MFPMSDVNFGSFHLSSTIKPTFVELGLLILFNVKGRDERRAFTRIKLQRSRALGDRNRQGRR